MKHQILNFIIYSTVFHLSMCKNKKEILNGLIFTVNHANPKLFLTLLKSDDILTSMPNKTQFYQFFSFMLNCSHCEDNYHALHKFKMITWKSKRWISLQFLKKNKKFPSLTFVFEYQNGKILLELLPF